MNDQVVENQVKRGPVMPTSLWDRFEEIARKLYDDVSLHGQWRTARALADMMGVDVKEARIIGRILGLMQKYPYLQDWCGLKVDVKHTVRPVKYFIEKTGEYNLDLEAAKEKVSEDVMRERKSAEPA